MAYFTEIEEVLDYLKGMIQGAATLAELKHVGLADDEMIFDYPAVILTAEPVTTELHATHQFQNHFRVALFVYHAQATDDRTTRTRDDIMLASKVRSVLHSDLTLSGGVIFGFVDSIIPGTIRRPGNIFAIGSRLSWYGRAKENF